MAHLEKYKILTNFQHGYRSKCSTETQLLKVIDFLAKGLENSSQIDVISLDFARAFDIVPFQKLLVKMNHYGIRKLLPWFENFLTGRTLKVILDGVKSRSVNILSGIIQGSVISGLLFLIFINDLPESITKSFTGLFCDDTLVAKEITNENDAVDLQEDLDKIFGWTQQWGMSFNTVKCVVMTVSNKQKLIVNNYHMNSMLPTQCLSKRDSIKYLGVTIDKNLSFKKHIEEKCQNATKILNLIRRNLYFAPRSVKVKAYNSCVRPILEYGAVCWSPTSDKMKNQIEMVQHRAAKFATNTYPKKGHYEDFSITQILKQLQWDTLEERRKQAIITMAYKILNNQVIIPPSSLPKATITRPARKCTASQVGSAHQLVERPSKLSNTSKTLFYCAPKLWNSRVTPTQAEAPSTDAFKKYFCKKSV